MKALISALLIILTSTTAAIAQQTALAELNDDNDAAKRNDQTLRDDRVLRHNDSPQFLDTTPDNRFDAASVVDVIVVVGGTMCSARMGANNADNLEHGPGTFYLPYIKIDGLMVLVVVNNADNLNRDSGIWTAGGTTGIAASDSPIEGIWTAGGTTSLTHGDALIFSVNSATEELYGGYNLRVWTSGPVNDMTAEIAVEKIQPMSMAKKNCRAVPTSDLQKCLLAQCGQRTDSAIDANAEAGELDNAEGDDGSDESEAYISHGNEEEDDGVDLPNIPDSWANGNKLAQLIIFFLNSDFDGDGNTVLEEIVNIVIKIFKGDGDGGSDGDGDGGNGDGDVDNDGDGDEGGEDGGCDGGDDCEGDDDRTGTGHHDPGEGGDGDPSTWY